MPSLLAAGTQAIESTCVLTVCSGWMRRQPSRPTQTSTFGADVDDPALVWAIVGAVASAAGAVFTLVQVVLPAMARRRASRQQPGSAAPSRLTLTQIADQLAVALRSQWEAEAAHQRLHDPHPIPVAWQPADPDLTDAWTDLVTTAQRWPGGPPPAPQPGHPVRPGSPGPTLTSPTCSGADRPVSRARRTRRRQDHAPGPAAAGPARPPRRRHPNPGPGAGVHGHLGSGRRRPGDLADPPPHRGPPRVGGAGPTRDRDDQPGAGTAGPPAAAAHPRRPRRATR